MCCFDSMVMVQPCQVGFCVSVGLTAQMSCHLLLKISLHLILLCSMVNSTEYSRNRCVAPENAMHILFGLAHFCIDFYLFCLFLTGFLFLMGVWMCLAEASVLFSFNGIRKGVRRMKFHWTITSETSFQWICSALLNSEVKCFLFRRNSFLRFLGWTEGWYKVMLKMNFLFHFKSGSDAEKREISFHSPFVSLGLILNT